ncbi:PAS domain S-box protein [Nocardioides sp. YIM 152315]|nr:PAS domain S-box protein [Nocardioides sp. YIM 152315]
MQVTPDGTELWRLTLQYSPVGMTLVGLDGRLLMVNHALCEMLGYAAEELSQRGFQELTHPDDLDADLEQFERALSGEIDSYRLRKRYLHADGHEVWGDLSVALVRDPVGEPLHFVSQILDVSEQHEYEQRLRAANDELEHERQTLSAIFDTVNVGLLLIDRDGRYERMNRRHAETMRLPFPGGHAGEAGQVGHVYFPDGRLMSTEDMPSYRAAHGAEFDDYTYWVGDDAAARTAFSTSARQVRGPSGERIGAALAYQEITDLMRAMRVKDEFVSSVSHELRTPLTTVLGYLELLADRPDLPSDAAGQVRIAQRNALRLLALVSDVLDVARAEAGHLVLARMPTDLTTLVHEAVETSAPEAEHRGVSVRVDAPERLVAEVDESRLRQVVDNLVSNGVKYSERGDAVTVSLRAAPGAVEIEVSDTGIGIAPDEVAHVFDPFFRGGQVVASQISGTGLGLNIVQSIVVAHGGTITLDSEPSRGSTFRVTLPSG